MLVFRVAAQYGRGPEQSLQEFKKEDEAKKFIQDKLQQDAALKVNVTYLLYDMGELVDSFDQSRLEVSADSGGQQQSNTNSFRPTPLHMTPRPKSVPPSSFKNEDDEDKKNK